MLSIPILTFGDYFFILLANYLCIFYVYLKISKVELQNKSKIIGLFYGCTISLLCALLRANNIIYYGIIFIALTFLIILISGKQKLHYSIPLCFISIGLSYCMEILSIFILGSIFYIWNLEINIFTETCVSILQFFLIILLLKIKRIRNGFVFLEDKNNFGLGLIISGPIIIMTCLQKEPISDTFLSIITIGIVVSAIGLILWIRSAITKHYRKRLKLRAEEYSKIELAEKEKEIKKLSDENTSLSSIIHLDNHIIQSIESELKALNNSELADKLLTSINQRNEYVNDLLIKSKNLASTGNAEIDAVLLDLYIKSASRGIDYNLSADCDINYLLNNIISLSGFEALLRNLITNSIVDIENNSDTPGRISIKISQPNDIYELTVMDNGVFNDNNSIPDIIEKSNASILINKFDNNDSFTKSVTIRFDGMKSVI